MRDPETGAAGNTIEAVSEFIKLVADLFIGTLDFVQPLGGIKLSRKFTAIARVLNMAAGIQNQRRPGASRR